MASEFVEYEFILPDGSKRYEMVARGSANREVAAFKRMYNAVIAKPLRG